MSERLDETRAQRIDAELRSAARGHRLHRRARVLHLVCVVLIGVLCVVLGFYVRGQGELALWVRVVGLVGFGVVVGAVLFVLERTLGTGR